MSDKSEPQRPYYDSKYKEKQVLSEVAEIIAQLPKGLVRFGEYVLLNSDRCTGTRVKK